MLHNKVTIIGVGSVGSTIAYTLMLSTLATEIVLIDNNKDKAEGEAMDLKHCLPHLLPIKIHSGNYSDCEDSKIIIIAAGAAQKPNESRLNLAQRNTEIFESIINNIKPYYKNSIILVVTNPVDILTYITIKLLNIDYRRIIGSGTILDTARFRYFLSEFYKVDPRNINAYIIGEHGDSSVPVWSKVNVSGLHIKEFRNENNKIPKIKQKLHKEVVKAAYRIIEKKGSTYYAIAVAVKTIVESILRNQSTILMISSLLNGQYDIDDVCLSLPTVVDSSGVNKVLDINLNAEETFRLRNSANVLKKIISQLTTGKSHYDLSNENLLMEDLQLLKA